MHYGIALSFFLTKNRADMENLLTKECCLCYNKMDYNFYKEKK